MKQILSYKIMFKKFFVGFMLLIVIVVFILSQLRRCSIIENHTFAVGRIIFIEEKYNPKMGRCCTYSFTIKNKKMTGGFCSTSLSQIFKNDSFKEKMLRQDFPVIYNRENFENNILIFESDFKRFNLVYPDSLSWTEMYLKYAQ